jgi:hypothetical protein
VDEGRKRVIGVMAAILASLHMQTADDLFGGPQGSPRTDKLIAASIQWAERIMTRIDEVFREVNMSIKATAVVKKETKVDPQKPADKVYYASLSILDEHGKEYGPPRYLSEFREVAVLLTHEAGVTHEQLHERHAAYERGEEIRFPLTLDSDEAIRKLGFDLKAA